MGRAGRARGAPRVRPNDSASGEAARLMTDARQPAATAAPPPPGGPARWTRRRFLRVAGAGIAGLAVAGIGVLEAARGRSGASGPSPGRSPGPSGRAAPSPSATPDAHRTFRSRPDLRYLPLTIGTPASAVATGLLFLTPSVASRGDGPLIVDDVGEPAWLHPVSTSAAANLRLASYRGEPVLTWWEGTINGGYGQGEFVIADRGYREVARVRAANGLSGDLHEFLLTEEGTALFATMTTVPPLRPGGPALQTAVLQEIDVASGRLLFEWHSLDHISPDESNQPAVTKADQPYDYLHLNSIDIDHDGNLLVSGRHTFAVYKVDRASGAVIWRLGGQRSDFSVDADARFAWQHDARRQPDGSITLFDDNAAPNRSRGLVLAVDEVAMTARVRAAFLHPGSVTASSQGSMQVLPNGNALVGWGSEPFVTEFGAAGDVRFDASLPPGGSSYRSLRFAWQGRPIEQPALALNRDGGGQLTVFASWNGATEVHAWEVLGGHTGEALSPVARAARSGFETAIRTPGSPERIAVRALGADGAVLGLSAVTTVAAVVD